MSRPAPAPAAYRWDAAARRYRSASGRLLSEAALRRAIEAQVAAVKAEVRQITQDLLDGRINRSEWYLRMESSLKRAHVITGVSAMGGRQQVAPSDLGWIGSQLRREYEFLRGFARDLESGRQPLDGRALARAEMYAEATRGTHREAERRRERIFGMAEVRSVLGAADHCRELVGPDGKAQVAGCIEEARKGWRPIDEPPPRGIVRTGARRCRSRCRCHLEFRAKGEREAA